MESTLFDHSIQFFNSKICYFVKMFDYLPMPENITKRKEMYGAGVQLIYGTIANRINVLYFYVLCALEENCMSPPMANLLCQFKADTFGEYGDCHRFDQSALNILLQWQSNFQMQYKSLKNMITTHRTDMLDQSVLYVNST